MTMNKEKIRQAVIIAFLLLLCAAVVLPLMWTFSTSLRSAGEAYKLPPKFLPSEFEFSNYTSIFKLFPFGKYILNSFVVAIATVILNVIVSCTAGFALARIPFKGKSVAFGYLMLGMMVPASATMVSLFLVMNKLKLVNTLWALILPAMCSPMYIFLVRQFMATIPKSYEEAAELDGCSRFRFFLTIAVPMSKPVIFMVALRTFIDSWNNFMGPLIYITDQNKMTLPIGLTMIKDGYGEGQLSVILAGVVLSLIVPTVLYLVGQKSLIEGVAMSGLKS